MSTSSVSLSTAQPSAVVAASAKPPLRAQKSNAAAAPTDVKAAAARAAPASSVTPSAAQAVLQESTETAAQTATEARGGDHQAQRLLQNKAAASNAPVAAGYASKSQAGTLLSAKA
jgi:hypothetical protein